MTTRRIQSQIVAAARARAAPVVEVEARRIAELAAGRVNSSLGLDAVAVSAAAFESLSKNLSSAGAVLSYSGGDLVSVAYASGITKTFGYSGGELVTVVLSGSVPGGVPLTKTLTYSGGDLTGITYS